jgi:hypothetical protein
MKSVGDPVFVFIRFWRDSLIDVLRFGIMRAGTAAKVNMDMSSHRQAHKIAQHRATIVGRGKFAIL